MTTCPLWQMQISTNKWTAHQNQTFGMSIKPLWTCICFHTKVINAWLTLFPCHSNCATTTTEKTLPHKKIKNYKTKISQLTVILSCLDHHQYPFFFYMNRNIAKITNLNPIRRKLAQTRKDLKVYLAHLPFNILWTFEFGVELFGRHGVGCIWHEA